MPLIMHNVSLLVVCLACTAHSRRVHSSAEQAFNPTVGFHPSDPRALRTAINVAHARRVEQLGQSRVSPVVAQATTEDEQAPPQAPAEPEEQSDDLEREKLKVSLFKMAAAYDRGYGATPSARKKMDLIIEQLESLNPTTDAARGILGDDDAPLRANWRMIWTTAQDVLSLASSPTTTVGAIYQIIEPPVATNIIDLIPRPQALLPPSMQPSSILRAEVTTRASPRENFPNRVGLTFESVKLKPVEVFGVQVPFLPPFSVDLPRPQIPGSTPETSPGYFDVIYLDDDLVIIKQNAPGGLFALTKADSYDP
mmetsp:Transcript_40365/g.75472  ORF Transcript_40365/g.75472 Transcript_40365/m.75472 type:complete len:310 (-) Transcript_40365:107-1036(-)